VIGEPDETPPMLTLLAGLLALAALGDLPARAQKAPAAAVFPPETKKVTAWNAVRLSRKFLWRSGFMK